MVEIAQAASTDLGKNSLSTHTAGMPPCRTCQGPDPILVNSPVDAPSWKLTATFIGAVWAGMKSAIAQ